MRERRATTEGQYFIEFRQVSSSPEATQSRLTKGQLTEGCGHDGQPSFLKQSESTVRAAADPSRENEAS